jgi:hypothetical protein
MADREWESEREPDDVMPGRTDEKLRGVGDDDDDEFEDADDLDEEDDERSSTF